MTPRVHFPSSDDLITAAQDAQVWLAKRRVRSAIVGAHGLHWYGLDRMTVHVDLAISRRVSLPPTVGGGHVVCHPPPEEKGYLPLVRDAIRDAVPKKWRGGVVRVATLGHLVALRMAFATGHRKPLAKEDIKTIVWGHKSPPRKPREVKAIRAVVKQYLGEFGASRFDDFCFEGELEAKLNGGRR